MYEVTLLLHLETPLLRTRECWQWEGRTWEEIPRLSRTSPAVFCLCLLIAYSLDITSKVIISKISELSVPDLTVQTGVGSLLFSDVHLKT